jgi:large subunit ribosomal protein L6
MSKIAKKPVEIKEGVNLSLGEGKIVVSGPKGTLEFKLPKGIKVEVKEDKVIVLQEKENDKLTRPLFGLTRSIIANLIKGVTDGFEKKLELSGVGYRAQASGNTLTLSVGYSHPVVINGGEGINFSVEENIITVSGADKALVGNVAAKVRSIRPPEPYKGKGIKYVGERIRRKAGKAAKTVGVGGGEAK